MRSDRVESPAHQSRITHEIVLIVAIPCCKVSNREVEITRILIELLLILAFQLDGMARKLAHHDSDIEGLKIVALRVLGFRDLCGDEWDPVAVVAEGIVGGVVVSRWGARLHLWLRLPVMRHHRLIPGRGLGLLGLRIPGFTVPVLLGFLPFCSESADGKESEGE